MPEMPPEAESRSRLSLSVLLLALAAYAVLLWWAASIGGSALPADLTGDDARWLVPSLLGFFAGLAVHTLVHEAGHLVAAVVLRLPVLGIRVGRFQVGLAQRLPGTSGHVLVDVSRSRAWVPGRMMLLLLAGPGANLTTAALAAALANGSYGSVGLRAAAAGVAVAGAYLGLGSLLPRTSAGASADGPRALGWLLHPARERAQLRLRVDLGRLRARRQVVGTGGTVSLLHLRELVDDPRPEMAQAAMAEFLRSRGTRDDGWADAPLMARFAQRREISGDVRAAFAGNYALSLGLSYARAHPVDPRGTDAPDAQPPELLRIARLAELARDADRESLQARTALALARVLQGTPAEARSALIDVPDGASSVLRARALAVRTIAETQLGDPAQATRLSSLARRLAPQDRLVAWADSVLAGSRPEPG